MLKYCGSVSRLCASDHDLRRRVLREDIDRSMDLQWTAAIECKYLRAGGPAGPRTTRRDSQMKRLGAASHGYWFNENVADALCYHASTLYNNAMFTNNKISTANLSY